MFPTKISMATDGSAEALRATRMVKTVFERLDSELHPVRVAPTPDPGVEPGARFSIAICGLGWRRPSTSG